MLKSPDLCAVKFQFPASFCSGVELSEVIKIPQKKPIYWFIKWPIWFPEPCSLFGYNFTHCSWKSLNLQLSPGGRCGIVLSTPSVPPSSLAEKEQHRGEGEDINEGSVVKEKSRHHSQLAPSGGSVIATYVTPSQYTLSALEVGYQQFTADTPKACPLLHPVLS